MLIVILWEVLLIILINHKYNTRFREVYDMDTREEQKIHWGENI